MIRVHLELMQHCQTRSNAARGMEAEQIACRMLAADGWQVLGRRVRTKAGEIDAIAEKAGLLVFVEIKSRATLDKAAYALQVSQKNRLLAAAEIMLGEHPEWGEAGVRFDVMLIDRQQNVARIEDAFRLH